MLAERRERWDKPGVRERHIEAMADPDVREVLRQKLIDRQNDPNARQKLVDAVRAARAQPVIIDGQRYPSVKAAAEADGTNYYTVIDRLGNPNWPSYQYVGARKTRRRR